jgi:hypothetical protein
MVEGTLGAAKLVYIRMYIWRGRRSYKLIIRFNNGVRSSGLLILLRSLLPHGRWVWLFPNHVWHQLTTVGARVNQVGVNLLRWAVAVIGVNNISEMMRPLACENSVEDISQVVSSLSCSVACYIKALRFGMLAGVLGDSLIAVVDRRHVAQRLQ